MEPAALTLIVSGTPPLLLLLLLLLLLMLLLLLRRLVAAVRRRRRFTRTVDRVPGPRALPLIGSMIHFLGVSRGDLFSKFDELTRQYWPVMRTWNGISPDVHLSSAQHIERHLGSMVNMDKAWIYGFMKPWLGDGLLLSTGKKWHVRRKLVTPTFHFNILEHFLDVFNKKAVVLVHNLEKQLGNEKGFDVSPYVTLCTLDIICETAMGTEINAQDNPQSDFVKATYRVAELLVHRLLRPWLYPDFMFKLSPSGRDFYKNVSILHGFSTRIIQERKKALSNKDVPRFTNEDETIIGRKRRLAFLDLLLEASQGGTLLTDEDIREEVDTFMFEGHDTTSAAICWALFLLGTHEDVQEKVYQELEDIFQGSDRAPTMWDLGEMKYLERVIKESLRLYPSVPFVSRRVVEDVQVGEYTIPAGCDSTIHIFHVHRDPQHFPNPDKFVPDNFLPERVQGRHPYAYIPFSAGSRNCIGQKFALLEEKAVLSALLRRFSLAALDRREDLKLTGELILRPLEGVRLRLGPRSPRPARPPETSC